MKWIRFFRTIQAKLIIIYVLLILIAMQLIGVYFVSVMKNSLTSNFTIDLKEKSRMLSRVSVKYLEAKPEEGTSENGLTVDNLSNLIQQLLSIDGEIQVLDASGKVLTTSLQDHKGYIGRKNTSTVVSRALQRIPDNEDEMIDENHVRKKIIANPVVSSNGKVLGVVYIVASMKELYSTIERINNIFISGTLIALGLTASLCVILAHTITNPIKEITKHATAVAEGRFDQRVPVFGTDEIGQLSSAFNYMTQRLRDALSLNEEEKEKLESVLTNMSDGVVATDDLGHVIVINRRAKEMLQIDEKEAKDKDISQLLGISKQQFASLEMGIRQTTLINVALQGGDDEVIIRVMFSPIHRRGEGITGTIVVLQDVTEQEKLDQSRREFVANVSHELRTPLTTIKSYVEALDDGALEEPQLASRFVGVISNETERMIRLVTDLLHLSRLDSKQAILRKQPTKILEMLEEVSDRFSFQMQQKRIKPSIFIEKGIDTVMLDRDQIDQVLDNLVSNAMKYTPDGGFIELEACNAGPGKIAISVKDNGMGIPKKDLDRIFDRFYRVDKARSRSMGGTGLGLSIAREIVKAHGGSIALESELNVGTKVTFTILAPVEGGEA